jgi:DNA-binding XRE family transcriptional regulator
MAERQTFVNKQSAEMSPATVVQRLRIRDDGYMQTMTNTNRNRDAIPEFTIGDRLRKSRSYARVSTAEMAAVLECSERTIGNYENEVTQIRRPSLVAWAMRCGVDVRWLATGIEPEGDTIGYRISAGQRRRRGPPGRVCGLSVVT